MQRLSHVLTHWHIWLHLLAHWHVLLGSVLSAIVLALVVVWLLTTVKVSRALLNLVLTETTLGALVLWAGSTYLLGQKLLWEMLRHNAGKLAKDFLLLNGISPRILSVFIYLLRQKMLWGLLHNAGKLAKEFLLFDGVSPLFLGVFLSPLTEPNFFRGIFILDISYLLYLVMADAERAGLTCNLSVVELFLGSRGSIWLSEADETEEILFTCSLRIFREESDALNFTKWREDFTNGLFSRVIRNVLDVQVVSLL